MSAGSYSIWVPRRADFLHSPFVAEQQLLAHGMTTVRSIRRGGGRRAQHLDKIGIVSTRCRSDSFNADERS
jgi:hypothetical protein